MYTQKDLDAARKEVDKLIRQLEGIRPSFMNNSHLIDDRMLMEEMVRRDLSDAIDNLRKIKREIS